MAVCRCEENCNLHVRKENNLTLTAACTDYCWSHVGPTLAWQWRLFIGGTTPSDPFVEVPGLDSIATGKSNDVAVYFHHTCNMLLHYLVNIENPKKCY